MGILFKPELAALVMAGRKTQTRRAVKPGDMDTENWTPGEIETVTNWNATSQTFRTRWTVGSDYAVIPGMYKHAIGRIRITDIRREDVRQISEEDARAEGFTCAIEFWQIWASLNLNRSAAKKLDNLLSRTGGEYSERKRVALMHLNELPLALFDAWALTFEVVK